MALDGLDMCTTYIHVRLRAYVESDGGGGGDGQAGMVTYMNGVTEKGGLTCCATRERCGESVLGTWLTIL